MGVCVSSAKGMGVGVNPGDAISAGVGVVMGVAVGVGVSVGAAPLQPASNAAARRMTAKASFMPTILPAGSQICTAVSETAGVLRSRPTEIDGH